MKLKNFSVFLTFKVLKLLGLQLQLNHCSICKSNKNIKTINWSAGGFVCRGCFKNEQQIFPISLLQALYELNHEPEFEQWEINQDDLYVLIPFYYEYLSERGVLSYQSLKPIKEKWILASICKVKCN